MVAQLETPRALESLVEAPRPRIAESPALWFVAFVAIALAAGAAWILRGAPYPPGGVGGDEAFRVLSVGRDAGSWFPSDFAYRGLPVFYPPLYFYALGRLSALTGLAPYESLKVGTIVIGFLVPIVAFGLWRRLSGDVAVALAIAVAGLAVHEWYEPYAWIATVVFIPWWFRYVVHSDDRTEIDGRRVVVGSLLGGAILMTYYYPFFIGGVHLAAVVIVGLVSKMRGRASSVRVTRESWCVLAGVVAVSAVYWGPLGWRAVTSGSFTSLQNRYFGPSMVAISLPFLHATIEGLVMAFGLAALVVLARRDRLAMGLLTLLAAAYAWWIFGQVAVLADSPVSAFRTYLLVETILLAGTGLGAVAALRALRTDSLRRVGVTLGVVLAVLFVVSSLAAMPYVEEQRDQQVPSALLERFDRATAGRSTEVVLASASPLVGFRSPYLFNVWNAHYSNPTSEFAARSRFLARLASEQDPHVFAAAVVANRYDRIGVVLLAVDGKDLTYDDFRDNFPHGTKARRVTFDRAQFTSRWFEGSIAADYAIFTTHGDPLRSLDSRQRTELRQHFPGDLAIDA